MSVRVMSAAWTVDLPAGEKLVLLALADCANDEGKCWPGLSSLAKKTGKCRRSLIDSIHALEKAGHISREVLIGKGTNYTIHPTAEKQPELPMTRAKTAPVSGAGIAPVQKPHRCKNGRSTGAKSAPKPSIRTVISSEPKGSSPRAWSLPTGVSLSTWTDFLTNRKRKRLVNTESTWKTFQDDLKRVSSQTGIPPPKLIELCTGKGWGGIYDPRESSNGKRTDSMGRHQPSDGLSPTTRAAVAVFGR